MLELERERLATEEARKARALFAVDINQKAREVAELQDVLKERETRLAQAQRAQADLIRKERELGDARREIDLTIEKRVQEDLAAVRSKATQEAEQTLKLKVLEKEEQLASMRRQIEILKLRAEQGSQQLQGEAQELELELLLRAKFPRDAIEPVPKGEFGGDVLHRVKGPLDQYCGTILWETKRTRHWSDAWIDKLKDDQRAAKAELALIISRALPKGVLTFDLIDGVWVSEPRCAVAVATILRQSLIEIAAIRQSLEGQQTKSALIYRYLTSHKFRQRIETIIEKFTDMQADLERERKVTTRLWAKREAQIRGVIESTAGMYGDLQGIAGKALNEVANLELPLLEAPHRGRVKNERKLYAATRKVRSAGDAS